MKPYFTKYLNIIRCLVRSSFLDEDNPYPVGHGVGARAPEVPVDDDHSDQDAHRVHDEGEKQVLRVQPAQSDSQLYTI
jgi:hypothetical protein